MGTYSVGEAINLLLEKSHWKPKVNEIKLQKDWENIVGKTIAKYTRDLKINNKILTIYTDIAPLKQELQFGKVQLIIKINEYFQEKIIEDVIIK